MFQPQRAAGLRRLADFLPRAGRAYRDTRNYDLGPGERDNVSCLSPWLRRRLLLEDEVLGAVLARHDAETAAKFIDEVFWRSYFRGWMAWHPDTWPDYRQAVTQGLTTATDDPGLAERLAAAKAGRTGIGAFDHWAGELVDQGYLHNHARMWFASIWVFTLRLPWALGADHFLCHLLDGDPASNTLGWRWVAGLHTRGKTYLARRDNILKFTRGRLDPGPGLAEEAPTPEEVARPERRRPRLPDLAPSPVAGDGWLFTDEDCRGGTPLPDRDLPMLGLVPREGLASAPAEAVTAFRRGAVRDALARAGAEETVLVETAEAVAQWAQAQDIQRVHAWHVPYGPAAEALASLDARLSGLGRVLVRHLREHDRRAWPQARRGFFALKKHIPAMLEDMDPALIRDPDPADA